MIDLTAITQEVSDTEGTDASVEAFIAKFAAAQKQAVADAIAATLADDAAKQAAVDAATQTAMDAVTARFVAARGALAAAITA